MSRVLVYTSPARGHLFPIVPVLLELQARGHAVAMRTLGAQVERMRALGFDAAPVDPALEAIAHDDFEGRTPLAKMERGLEVFMRRAPLDAADLRGAIAGGVPVAADAPRLRGAMRAAVDARPAVPPRGADEDAVGPDALLVDLNTWGAAIVAEASGLPWAQWSPYLLPLPSRDAPPWGPGFKPRAGLLGRVRDRATGRILGHRYDAIVLERLNAARRDAGLAPLRSATEALTRSPLLLYLTAEPMEYPRSDWPPSVRMVGPCGWEPEAEEPPAWLAEDDRPIVLVTLSSEFQDDGALVAAALEALRDEPVRVVATTLDTDPATFDAPPDARVERFVPHGPLLERAACVVCHGGMGITQKALARGVPVCVVPFGRDQLETARHVEVAGAGTRLPAGRLSARRLRAAVRGAVRCRPGAERMARAFAAAGGAIAAADAFEELLAAAPSIRPSA